MRDIFRITICSTAVLFISFNLVSTPAQFPSQNRSTISGYVFDTQRLPVAEVAVELLNEYNSVIRRVRTEGSGRFLFTGLASGRYVIRVLPLGTGLQEQSEEVEIFGIGVQGRSLSDNIQKDIYLRARRSDDPGVTGTIFAQEVPENARKDFEKAISELHDKKIDAAIAGLESALRSFPTYYLALEQMGQIYIAQGQYEKAIDIYSKAVVVNPGSFNCWYGLGYANYALQRSDAAVEASKKAVVLNSSSADAVLTLGLSLRQAKRFDEAEKTLKQANKLTKGKSPDVHWNLALLYAHNLKRYKDAADELELYLKTKPDSPNKEQVQRLIRQFRENPPN